MNPHLGIEGLDKENKEARREALKTSRDEEGKPGRPGEGERPHPVRVEISYVVKRTKKTEEAGRGYYSRHNEPHLQPLREGPGER